ncbi:MAG TPA: hypothetical protein EYG53_11415 [Gammaproteobacteria bacterium]|nr:hypothetical protein [Gammaproteobacteria bacterium]
MELCSTLPISRNIRWWCPRASKDGKDGVQVDIISTSNLPSEFIEQEYPLRVEEYSLIMNSGGAEKFGGGVELRRVVNQLITNVCLTLRVSGSSISPGGYLMVSSATLVDP